MSNGDFFETSELRVLLSALVTDIFRSLNTIGAVEQSIISQGFLLFSSEPGAGESSTNQLFLVQLNTYTAMVPSLDETLQKVTDNKATTTQRKRRGKAIVWKYVRKYANLPEAKENFTRGNLIEKEQFLGRKYNGKTSAIYINCQKVVCGCMKKWRLLYCQANDDVTLEETSEEHSNHDLFVRSGGHGLSQQQIQLTQKALSQNHRMKPLQIVNFFSDVASRELMIDPTHIVVPTPDIVRLSSYLSYQRRKLSGAINSTSKKKSIILTKNILIEHQQIEQNSFYLSEISIVEQSTKKLKSDSFSDQNTENVQVDKSFHVVEECSSDSTEIHLNKMKTK